MLRYLFGAKEAVGTVLTLTGEARDGGFRYPLDDNRKMARKVTRHARTESLSASVDEDPV